jgi:hypothetical protein
LQKTETFCDLLICGSRHVRSVQDVGYAIARALRAENLRARRVITGDALGVDQIAATIARSQGIPVVTFSADWVGNGRAAGPIRNGEMVQELLRSPGMKVAIALRVEGVEARGTDDTVSKCRAHNELKIFEITLDRSSLSY